MSVFFGLFFNWLVYCFLVPFTEISVDPLLLLNLPTLFITLFLLSLGAGIVLSILSLFMKDITHIWDMIILVGFWTSGIFFQADQVNLPEFELFSYVNPLVGLIENFRRVVFFGENPDFFMMYHNFIYGLVLYLIGYFAFKKYSHLILEKI